ncbi:hypothetical protein UlMin_014857 [Ulmus minor]
MTILRKRKEVGISNNGPELEPTKQKKYLRTGALYNILVQKRKSSLKGKAVMDEMLYGSPPVRKKRTVLSRFAAPEKVVLDSPPALSTRSATHRMVCSKEASSEENMTDKELSPMSSKRTRRSLIDEVEGLVEGDVAEAEWEPEQVALLEPNDVSPHENQDTSAATKSVEPNPENHNLEHYNPENENDCSNALKQKKRGRTKLSSLAKRNDGLIPINWNNKGQPIGKQSVWLSSFLGALVREIVPYTLCDWRRLSPAKYDILWASIQAKYDLHTSWHKKWCFKVMADLWRASKSRLVTDLINATTENERLALKPDCIKSDVEWRSFIKLKTSKEHLVLRSKFQERRKKKAPITLSRRGYARTIDDMVITLV